MQISAMSDFIHWIALGYPSLPICPIQQWLTRF